LIEYRFSEMEEVGLKYVVEIVECCHELLLLPNLEPSVEVSGIFNRLVSVCSGLLDESVTNAVCPPLNTTNKGNAENE
jgi:hypothetical protein